MLQPVSKILIFFFFFATHYSVFLPVASCPCTVKARNADSPTRKRDSPALVCTGERRPNCPSAHGRNELSRVLKLVYTFWEATLCLPRPEGYGEMLSELARCSAEGKASCGFMPSHLLSLAAGAEVYSGTEMKTKKKNKKKFLLLSCG